MNLGFTLDEKIFSSISPDELLKECAKEISSIELAADRDILDLSDYKSILKTATSHLIDINYHIPYFANELYETSNFIKYSESKARYEEFLNLLESFQEDIENKPIIVVHGVDYEKNKTHALDTTMYFIDYMLNEISKRNLPFTLALETLRKKSVRNTFDNREDLKFILDKLKCERLRVCWDMCHDKLNFYPSNTPVDEEFLDSVVYAHIHGHKLETDSSHLSLKHSDLDYSRELSYLKENPFLVLNIELLKSCVGESYISDLFYDMSYLKNYL